MNAHSAVLFCESGNLWCRGDGLMDAVLVIESVCLRLTQIIQFRLIKRSGFARIWDASMNVTRGGDVLRLMAMNVRIDEGRRGHKLGARSRRL